MDEAVRVVLALEATQVAEEILHYLDRSGLARVVGTATDDRQLAEATRQLEPDVVVAQSSMTGVVRGTPVLAVDARETVGALRAALDGGARGFFVWPDDRERLLGSVARSVARAAAGRVGMVIAVRGARGGAGATFVAAHLPASFVRAGHTCVLVDGDPIQGDLTSVLGAPASDVRTLSDLVPVADELDDRTVEEVLWTHEAGFRVVLAAEPSMRGDGSALAAVATATARVADVVVVHLPRTVDERTHPVLAFADRVVHVLTLDTVSFRAADRALEALSPLRLASRSAFLVNRAARSEIVPADVRRVFGDEPLAVIPADRAVVAAMHRGRLVGHRGRVGRALDRAASRALDTVHEDAA